jgi:hypothetical protein
MSRKELAQQRPTPAGHDATRSAAGPTRPEGEAPPKRRSALPQAACAAAMRRCNAGAPRPQAAIPSGRRSQCADFCHGRSRRRPFVSPFVSGIPARGARSDSLPFRSLVTSGTDLSSSQFTSSSSSSRQEQSSSSFVVVRRRRRRAPPRVVVVQEPRMIALWES